MGIRAVADASAGSNGLHVLVVEDEEAILDFVEMGLRYEGFEVERAAEGPAALAAFARRRPDLVVLDLNLPGLDGLEVCRQIRRSSDVPIIMLTARGEVDERVEGLEAGADDYLPKPFDFSELLARLRALVRRDKVHKGRVIQIADLEVDTAEGKVRRAGQEIHLTPREYRLLEALAVNEGRVLSREMIQDRVWMDDESYSNTVDVHITFLRKKIDAGHDLKLIHTVHRAGYTLRGPETEAS